MNHSAGTFPSVIAVLPAAGIGSRMQAECPKQYLTIGRHSIVEHAIHALLRHPRIERVIVAIGPFAYAVSWKLDALLPGVPPEFMLLLLAVGWSIYLPAVSWLQWKQQGH